MIGIVTTLATATCRHCALPIHLGKSDIEREAYWTHDATGRPYCADAPMAEPDEAQPVMPARNEATR